MRTLIFWIMAVVQPMFLLTGGAVAQSVSLSGLQEISQVIELASCGQWEIIKQEKGVTLRSRWLSFGDTLKTREISANFIVENEFDHILANLFEPHLFKSWNDGVRDFRILENEYPVWVSHIIYDIPYPFSQQDLVAKNTIKQSDTAVIITITSLPDYISPLSGVSRQQLYFGQWELLLMKNGKTTVNFSAISFSRSNIPRFLRDHVIQVKLLNSFVSLKELSESQKELFSNR